MPHSTIMEFEKLNDYIKTDDIKNLNGNPESKKGPLMVNNLKNGDVKAMLTNPGKLIITTINKNLEVRAKGLL